MREECDNFPKVLASPKQENLDIKPHEIPDFDLVSIDLQWHDIFKSYFTSILAAYQS